MAIEIRQLVVKSNLVQKAPDPESPGTPAVPRAALETLRQSVLAECRAMIAEAMRQTRER